MAFVTGSRIFLYFALLIFAISQLGMTTARLHYTLNVPYGDPVNGGQDFYDPIIVELLVSSGLTMIWTPFLIVRILKRHEHTFISTFGGELIGLFVLFMLWICGVAISTHKWGDLAWCRVYQPCRLLTAIVAFAWIGWIMLLFLILINLGFILANDAFNEPLHGYYDPRSSSHTDPASGGTNMRQNHV